MNGLATGSVPPPGNLMGKARRISLFVTLVPILVMTGIAVVLVMTRMQVAVGQLEKVVNTEASALLRADVSTGKLNISPSGVLHLQDIVIRQPGATDHPIIVIPQMNVGFRLIDVVLRRAEPMQSIDWVEMKSPKVYIERYRNGRWNISDLLKPTARRRPLKFSGVIMVHQGQVRIRDFAYSTHRAETNVIKNLDARLDMTTEHTGVFGISAEAQRDRLGRVVIRGRYRLDTGAFRLGLEAQNADLAYWSRYPRHIRFLTFDSGKADVQAEVSNDRRGKLGYRGVLNLRDAKTRFAALPRPITHVNGRVFARNDRFRLDARGRLGSTPFSVYGDVAGLHRPNILLEFNSGSANLRELFSFFRHSFEMKSLKIPYPGRCRIVARGPSHSPRVEFEMHVPLVAKGQFSAQEVKAVGEYFRGRISLRQISGQALGGHIFGAGWVAGNRFELQGTVSKLEMGHVPYLAERGFSGATAGRFCAYRGDDGTRLDYVGGIRVGSLKGVKFSEANVSATYSNDVLWLEEVSARVMGGLVAASGMVHKDGTLSLDVSGADIDLATLQKRYWREDTQGRLYFAGRIGGTLDNPLYEGRAEAQPVRIRDVSMERADAKFAASRALLNLHELKIYKLPGDVTVSGIVHSPMNENRGLKLTVKVADLRVGPLLRDLKSEIDADGELSAEIALDGSTQRPVASGEIHMANACIAGHEVDNLRAAFNYGKETLTVSELSLQAGMASVLGSGELKRDGTLQGEFVASRVPIADFARSASDYLQVSGEANVRGTISGKAKKPDIVLRFDAKPFKVNGETLGEMSGTVLVQDGRHMVSGVTVSDSDSLYRIANLDYSKETQELSLEGTLTGGSVSRLLRMFERSAAFQSRKRLSKLMDAIPKPVDGKVDGTIKGSVHFAGDKVSPDLSWDLTFRDLRSGTGDFEKAEMRGAWKGELTRLDYFKAISGDTSISASGAIGPSRQLTLNFDAHHVQISSVGKWLGMRDNLSGIGDVTIVASGTTLNPVGQASIEITNPSIGPTKFHGLRVRLSTGETLPVGSGVQPLRIDELTLVLATKELTASGVMPVEWRNLTIPEQGDLSLKADFDSALLDLLPVFTTAVEKESIGGSVAGSVSISVPIGGGRPESPTTTGSIVWKDGRVRLAGVDTEFRNMDLRCSLDGDTIRIDDFSGLSSQGGNFALSGEIKLTEQAPKLNLALRTSDLGLSWNNLTKAYHEKVSCALDCNVSVTGQPRSPLVHGTIGVRKGTIDLTAKRSEVPVKRGRAFDPHFGETENPLRVTVGRDVELKSGIVRTPIRGDLVVYGSLSNPYVEGRLDMSGGTIHFPARTLRIQPASVMTVQYRPPTVSGAGQEQPRPPAVVVDMKAQGRVIAMSGLGRRKQYTVTMVASGPLDSLRPSFTSSPAGLSEQQILALLTGQYEIGRVLMAESGEEVSRGLSSLFSTAMSPVVFEPIGEALGAALGFEEFALEGGYQEPLQLSITDQLTGPLYITYTSSLGARPDYADSRYELRLEYRFPRGVELGLITNEQKEVSIQLEGRLRF